jgi:hypothetical protein
MKCQGLLWKVDEFYGRTGCYGKSMDAMEVTCCYRNLKLLWKLWQRESLIAKIATSYHKKVNGC